MRLHEGVTDAQLEKATETRLNLRIEKTFMKRVIRQLFNSPKSKLGGKGYKPQEDKCLNRRKCLEISTATKSRSSERPSSLESCRGL